MLVVTLIFVAYFTTPNNAKHTEILQCPISSGCSWVFPLYLTQHLACLDHMQCPLGFKCCSDCHFQHRVCRIPEKLKLNKACPKTTKHCDQKYQYEATSWFKCATDGECDADSLCCRDDCYAHKICRKAIAAEEDQSMCPRKSEKCPPLVLHQEPSKNKCTAHDQCQKSHACCLDNCYNHKICKPKRIRESLKTACPIQVRKQSCSNKSGIKTKYICKVDGDCHLGYVCCTDSCYSHKVCKLPNGAFSYRGSNHKSNNTALAFKEIYKCPKLEKKCFKLYPKEHIKKITCARDDDCKLGHRCCEDPCAENVKICKDVVGESSLDKYLKAGHR